MDQDWYIGFLQVGCSKKFYLNYNAVNGFLAMIVLIFIPLDFSQELYFVYCGIAYFACQLVDELMMKLTYYTSGLLSLVHTMG